MAVAIVTGGAQGLGATISEALLRKGYSVCVADVDAEKGHDFVEKEKSEYGQDKVAFSFCDVSKQEDVTATFKLCVEVFGEINVVINNAGICLERDPRRVIDVNLMSVFYGIHEAINFMGKQNGGSGGIVISTASIAGFLPVERAPAYAASKHAIIGLTRSYGSSLHFERNGIIFAAICPSFIEGTEMTKTGKNNIIYPEVQLPSQAHHFVSRDFVAEGVLKLLEDRINGSTLVVSKEKGYQYVEPQEEVLKIFK